MRRLLFLLAACCCFATLANAQTYTYAVNQQPAADKIVAIVGDKIILLSDIEGQLQQYMQDSSVHLPPDANCFLLEQMMDQKALELQAERDSLPVTDEDVEGNLENRVRYFINLYGTQENMEKVTGLSIYQVKDRFRSQIKESMLADAMRKKIVDGVKITPTEVKDFFNKIPKDSLPFYKSEVEVGQVVINPKPGLDLVKLATDQLTEIKKEVESGQKSFEVMATLYSQDPGTRNNGGQMSININDKNIDPDFLAAAFRLQNGQVSPVIKSQFGYHIIQMVKRQGDNALIRHILIIPQVSTEDVNASLHRLDSIRTQIEDHKLSFGDAANQFSDDQNAKMTAGMFTDRNGSTFLTAEDLDPGVLLMVDAMKVGEISAPVSFKDPYGKMSTRILYLKTRTEPHRENLQEDYSKIQGRALQLKQYKVLNDWFNQKMPGYYLMLDDEFKGCPNIAKWVKGEEKTVKSEQ